MKEKLLNGLKGLCVSLGRHNDALYAVLAIAVFKGIFRPTFTMMDKKENPETKRYAAFREGLTEAVAFCSYLATSKGLKKIAKPICEHIKKPELQGPLEHSISFLAVCLSAGIVIPVVCNLALKPVMDMYKNFQKKRNCGLEKSEKAENKTLDIKEESVIHPKPIFHNEGYNVSTSGNLVSLVQKNMIARNAGMKVGV